MTDIAPELYMAIESRFNARMAVDPLIRSFNKKLEKKTASAEDVSEYARRVGECASAAMIAVLKEDNLPNGVLYLNIAEKTIKPIFKKAHELINEAAVAVQMLDDEKTGVGIKPIVADFPEERVNALIYKLVHTIADEGGDDEQNK